MTSPKPCIYPYLCIVVLLFGCNSTQHVTAERPPISTLSQQEPEIPKESAPFRECIEEPTKMFRYAIGEWRVKSIAVMPDAEQRPYPSGPMLTQKEIDAIRKARLTIREGEIQNVGLNPAGRLCAGQKFTQGSGHFRLFQDSFTDMGIDKEVENVYLITIDEVGYSYFLVGFDRLLAKPSTLIETDIGRIKLPAASYVIFEKLESTPQPQ